MNKREETAIDQRNRAIVDLQSENGRLRSRVEQQINRDGVAARRAGKINEELRAENVRLYAALQRIADRDVGPELKNDANVLAGMAWAAINK